MPGSACGRDRSRPRRLIPETGIIGDRGGTKREGGDITAQLLIYESVVPLSARRHGNSSVESGSGYGFTSKTNSVPLMAVEFPFAASEYPIVFAGTKENFVPAVILGVRESQNLYLSPDAKWEA